MWRGVGEEGSRSAAFLSERRGRKNFSGRFFAKKFFYENFPTTGKIFKKKFVNAVGRFRTVCRIRLSGCRQANPERRIFRLGRFPPPRRFFRARPFPAEVCFSVSRLSRSRFACERGMPPVRPAAPPFGAPLRSAPACHTPHFPPFSHASVLLNRLTGSCSCAIINKPSERAAVNGGG